MRHRETRPLVYVVDDDASVRRAIGRLLLTNGFQVTEFSSPEAFLNDTSAQPPACVLLDMTMPGLSGLQVQAHLNARGTRWPIIAVSAREDDSARSASRHLGAQFFLRKPVDAHALLDAIEWVTGNGNQGT